MARNSLEKRFALKLFYPNLSFEDELVSEQYRPNQASRRAIAELAPLMAWAGKPDDVCVVPELPTWNDDFAGAACLTKVSEIQNFDKTEFVPWGWSQQAVDFAEQNHLNCSAVPEVDVVRKVNGRAFHVGFDDIWEPKTNNRASFSFLCESLEKTREVARRLLQNGWQKWVVKPEISHAGRNRLIVSGKELNDQQTGWLRREFRQNKRVFAEPWVSIDWEGSLHFEILSPSSGKTAQYAGGTVLLNDAAGRFRGSASGVELLDTIGGPILNQLVQQQYSVGRRIAAEGYFGPAGLDFFSFRDLQDTRQVRICNDINARWTMGRLSLKIAERIGAKDAFRWEHFVSETAENLDWAARIGIEESGVDGVSVDGVTILRTSPDSVGGKHVRQGSLIFSGGCTQTVDRVARQVRRVLNSRLQGNGKSA